MSPAVIALLGLLAVVFVVAAIVRFAPSAVELLDLDPRARAGARLAAEEEDLEQLREIDGRDTS
jgi:hypothetical protein